MRFKTSWLRWAAAGLGCVVAGMAIAMWLATVTGERAVETEPPEHEAPLAKMPPPLVPTAVPATRVDRPPRFVPPSAASAEGPAIPDDRSAPRSQPPAAEAPASAKQAREDSISPEAVAKEELGRLALSYVGVDPVADEIWVWLINDPELSPKVRQDLIEDLNENGFSEGNGRRPTVDDLPLIESRILLLEAHAPLAMDEVNAAAFAEAYKDLVNMWWRLTEQ